MLGSPFARCPKALADAYGWPSDLSDDELLANLVVLNKERAEEEKRGIVRWWRPEMDGRNGNFHGANWHATRSGLLPDTRNLGSEISR
jgi:hypothetical protein